MNICLLLILTCASWTWASASAIVRVRDDPQFLDPVTWDWFLPVPSSDLTDLVLTGTRIFRDFHDKDYHVRLDLIAQPPALMVTATVGNCWSMPDALRVVLTCLSCESHGANGYMQTDPKACRDVVPDIHLTIHPSIVPVHLQLTIERLVPHQHWQMVRIPTKRAWVDFLLAEPEYTWSVGGLSVRASRTEDCHTSPSGPCPMTGECTVETKCRDLPLFTVRPLERTNCLGLAAVPGTCSGAPPILATPYQLDQTGPSRVLSYALTEVDMSDDACLFVTLATRVED